MRISYTGQTNEHVTNGKVYNVKAAWGGRNGITHVSIAQADDGTKSLVLFPGEWEAVK